MALRLSPHCHLKGGHAARQGSKGPSRLEGTVTALQSPQSEGHLNLFFCNVVHYELEISCNAGGLPLVLFSAGRDKGIGLCPPEDVSKLLNPVARSLPGCRWRHGPELVQPPLARQTSPSGAPSLLCAVRLAIYLDQIQDHAFGS